MIRPGCGGYAIQNADLFVLLGNRISLYYGCGLLLPKNARIVQVDIEPEEIGRKSLSICLWSATFGNFSGNATSFWKSRRQGRLLRHSFPRGLLN